MRWFDAGQRPLDGDERREKLGDGLVEAAGVLAGQELCKSGEPPDDVFFQEAVEPPPGKFQPAP